MVNEADTGFKSLLTQGQLPEFGNVTCQSLQHEYCINTLYLSCCVWPKSKRNFSTFTMSLTNPPPARCSPSPRNHSVTHRRPMTGQVIQQFQSREGSRWPHSCQIAVICTFLPTHNTEKMGSSISMFGIRSRGITLAFTYLLRGNTE